MSRFRISVFGFRIGDWGFGIRDSGIEHRASSIEYRLARPVTPSPRHLVSITLCLLAFLASAVSAQTWTKELALGVTLTQEVTAAGEGSPQIINVLRVDPNAPGVRIQAVLSQDKVFGKDGTKGRETVSSIAKRLGAAVVVNADYFPVQTNCPGDVLNLHISGGELMSEPMSNRAVFGLSSYGFFLFDLLSFDAKITLPDKTFPIRGINRPRKMHELVVYTPKFYSSTCTSSAGSEAVVKCDSLPIKVGVPITGKVSEVMSGCGDTPIPEGTIILSGAGTGAKFIDDYLKPGTPVTIEFDLKPSKTTGWDKVVEAVGGGPWLVKDGKVNVDAKEEGFQPAFYATAHPRTAVGVTANGMLVLATVDGRQSMSAGMSLADMGILMVSYGCVEAINLDGGGSTTMATASGILNSPCEGTERPVANALVVLSDAVQLAPDTEFTIAPLEPVPSGTTVQPSLLDKNGQPIDQAIANRAVWASTGGAGFIDQSGRFYGVKARKGIVAAKIGSRTASIPIETVPGPAAGITAKIEADPSGAPNRSMIAVSVTDANGNAVAGAAATVSVTGGVPDQSDLITAGDGKASTGITWDAEFEATAEAAVTVGDLPPVIVQRSSQL